MKLIFAVLDVSLTMGLIKQKVFLHSYAIAMGQIINVSMQFVLFTQVQFSNEAPVHIRLSNDEEWVADY